MANKAFLCVCVCVFVCVCRVQENMASKAFLYSLATGGPQYDDRGSRATLDLSVYYNPSTPVVYEGKELTQRLGQRPKAGYSATSFVYPLHFEDADSTVAIKGGHEWWTALWTDKGSGLPNDYSVWQVRLDRIPAGYVCLSPCFFIKRSGSQGNWQPPSNADVQGMVAIRQTFVTLVNGSTLVKVWDNKGMPVTSNVSIHTGPDGAGCFAFPNFDAPSAFATFPTLNRSRGQQVP